MKRRLWIFGLVLIALIVTACASRKLTEAGKKVTVVLDAGVVSACEEIANIVVFADSVTKGEEERLRENIARNQAAERGANAIIASGDPIVTEANTKQAYTAYFCK